MNTAAKPASPLLYIVAWLVLLLTGLSLLSAYLGLGVAAPIVQFGIAATQATIVFILFMRLKGRPSLKWLFAGAGFFWLLYLYGLSMTDYATRRGWP
jgi:cytochrome c oxidase subunit IV